MHSDEKTRNEHLVYALAEKLRLCVASGALQTEEVEAVRNSHPGEPPTNDEIESGLKYVRQKSRRGGGGRRGKRRGNKGGMPPYHRRPIFEHLEDRRLLTAFEAPSLLGPVNNSANQLTWPLFDWTDTIGANRYRVLVATDKSVLPTGGAEPVTSNLIEINQPVFDSQFRPDSNKFLDFGQTYYWQVRVFCLS